MNKYTVKKQNRYSGRGGFVSAWSVFVIVGPEGVLMNKAGTREREYTTREGAEKAIRKLWIVGPVVST